MKILTPVLLSACCLAGCLEFEFKEETPVLYMSSRRIVAPSDSKEGRNMVFDTLVIRSNRSWTASFTPEVEWVKIDTAGFRNMSKTTVETPVVLHFLDNDTEADRSVTLTVSSPAGERTVEIRQKAIEYRLELLSGTEQFSGVVSDGLTVPLSIRTNTDWTLSLRDGATAGVVFESSSGKYDAEVGVTVLENEEMVPKNAVVVISATGCRNIEIPVSQLEGIPYFRLLQDSEIVSDEGIPNTRIGIKTNMEWQTEVLSIEGYDPSSVVVPAGGGKTVSQVLITHPYSRDFKTPGKIVIRFTAKDVEEQPVVTITQVPVLRVPFGELTQAVMWSADTALGLTSSNWPFLSPTYENLTSSRNTAIHKGERVELTLKTGHKMYVYSTRGIWRHSKTGFMGGGEVGDYFELPAIPGCRLVKFAYTFRESSPLTGVLRSLDGTEIENTNFSVGGSGTQVVVGPFETNPGEAYRIVMTNTQLFNLGDLVLYYE